MAVLCKMNELRRSDYVANDDDFLRAIRLTTNHEDEILDSEEARKILKPTLERLAKEKGAE